MRWGALAGLLAAAAVACSLNPQPIPPGEEADGSVAARAPGGDDKNSADATASDAGAGAAEDAPASDGFPPPADAATDAREDADATADARADAADAHD